MGDRSSQLLDSAVFKIGDRVSAHAKAGSRLTLRFLVLEAHLHHLQFVGSEFCEGCHEDLTQLLALDPIQGVFRYQVGEEELRAVILLCCRTIRRTQKNQGAGEDSLIRVGSGGRI